MSSGKSPVVLLHSLGLCSEDYRPFIEAARPRCVRSVDLLGHGSRQTVTPESVTAMADDVWNEIETSVPVHLVGHSLGGAVAATLASSHPSAIASLAIVASPFAGSPVFLERARSAEQSGMVPQIEVTLERWFDENANPAVVAQIESSLEANSVANWAAAWRALGNFAGFDRLGLPVEISRRTLCLSSAGDRSTPPQVGAQIVSALPGSSQVVVAGGGHAGVIECAQEYADLLRTHWDRFEGIENEEVQ
ncbi:alpha/beta fold hydrolase [Leucobacter soli]|uniref:(E)-2-((N-methylformamido)methylene)succinate hydrolase n=1 Tax=Leucobacter soli TaxID=2812850 RepID=A0A916K168_9MICO|nr:(E)-2-((N-methylformamido)methylene)succinate hydrolase [Leucobacter soli]